MPNGVGAYTAREWDAIRSIANGQTGDVLFGRNSVSDMDTATARGLLSMYDRQQQAAPAPAPAAAPMQAPAPQAPPQMPQQQMLNQGMQPYGYQQQLYNMLQGFMPMMQGMYGLRGYGNWFPQQGAQQRPQQMNIGPNVAGRPASFATRYGM
jgi:hypothetical protein